MSVVNSLKRIVDRCAARRKGTPQSPGRPRSSSRHLLIESLEDRWLPSNYQFTSLDGNGAFGINNSGQIVGESFDTANMPHGFLVSGESYTTIGPPGSFSSAAYGINDSGQIVGQYNNHGFLLSGGGYTTIDPPGSSVTWAYGINNAGQIVGEFIDFTGWHGFLLSGRSYTTIDFPGSLASAAYGINDSGQIVGACIVPTGSHGFLLSGGSYTTIGPGSQYSGAFGINNAGQIVGTFSDTTFNGFLLSGGSYTTIDPPGSLSTQAFGINNSGQIVGQFYVSFTGNAADILRSFLATPVVTGNLGIVRSDGTELPHDQDVSPGGYVAVNNDNDDYKFDARGSTIQDKDKAGPVVGERDLVPLKLHKVDPVTQGGKYRLVFTSPIIKLWRSADKTGPVSCLVTEFDASHDTTVYVEGISESTAPAMETVGLRWVKGAEVVSADQVAFTVYLVKGPENVPGFSKYTYTGHIPGGATGSWTVTNGTIKEGTHTNTAKILWAEGPVVGVASFTAAPGFKVDRRVNIVQVELKITGHSKLTYHNPPTQRAVGSPLIDSAVFPDHAEDAKFRVRTIVGPTVQGEMRGVKFMEMGFIQDGMFTREFGDFDGFAPPQRLQGSLQDGRFHIDYVTGRAGVASTAPWYDTTGLTADQKSRNIGGFFAPAEDREFTDEDFSVSDTPFLAGVLTGQIAPGDPASGVPGKPLSLKIGGTTAQVTRFGIQFDLNLYFAVRTKEAINDSEKVYTQRAKAAWQFDGSGNVNAAGKWTQTGTGNTGDARFAEEMNGSEVPVTTGTAINKLFDTETWRSGPRPAGGAAAPPSSGRKWPAEEDTAVTDAYAALVATASVGTWGPAPLSTPSSPLASNRRPADDHVLASREVEVFFWAQGQDQHEERRTLESRFAGADDLHFAMDRAWDSPLGLEPDLVR
jgi:probable HAF family extracellular repeat protein